jgi:hypothetical protein
VWQTQAPDFREAEAKLGDGRAIFRQGQGENPYQHHEVLSFFVFFHFFS